MIRTEKESKSKLPHFHEDFRLSRCRTPNKTNIPGKSERRRDGLGHTKDQHSGTSVRCMIRRLKTPENCKLVLPTNFSTNLLAKHLFCLIAPLKLCKTGHSLPRTPLHACHNAHPALTAARGPTQKLRNPKPEKTSRCTVRESAGRGTRGPRHWVQHGCYKGDLTQTKVLQWVRHSRYRHAQHDTTMCRGAKMTTIHKSGEMSLTPGSTHAGVFGPLPSNSNTTLPRGTRFEVSA